jgi:high affinity Mn2+ porin
LHFWCERSGQHEAGSGAVASAAVAAAAAAAAEAWVNGELDAVGFSMQGLRWHRPGDTIGFAAVENGISVARERYLNAVGLGILIGDGRLPHPGPASVIAVRLHAQF